MKNSAGDAMKTSESRQLARRTAYEEQLRKMPPRGAIDIKFGGDVRRALQSLINGDSGRGEHYVYLHRAPDDKVFYVGKGKGNRAYSRDREGVWHHYVKTRCDGRYEVEIVKRFETEDEALTLEWDLIALFGEHTVNIFNTARKTDFDVNARFHKLRKANWTEIAAAQDLFESEPKEAEAAFRIAIHNMAEYARLNWEEGLLAELAAEIHPSWNCHLNANDLSALNKLTMLLKGQARWEELIAVTNEFFETYPETRSQGIAQQVIKRPEPGSRSGLYSPRQLSPTRRIVTDATVAAVRGTFNSRLKIWSSTGLTSMTPTS
jgi:hypothetical protein